MHKPALISSRCGPIGSRTSLACDRSREMQIETLRQEIRALERSPWTAGTPRSLQPFELRKADTHVDTHMEDMNPEVSGRCPGTPRPRPETSAPSPAPRLAAHAWTLGEPSLDNLLPAVGLDPAAIHEIKPETYASWPAAIAFALRLAVRRLGHRPASAPLLWCWPTALAAEAGIPYIPGFAAAGIATDTLLLVTPKRLEDALWTLEEGLKSQALNLLVAGLPSVGLTPARRLSLAAAAHATPCLLLTAPGRAATPAAATRWRVRGQPSAPHPLDPQAPGAPRYALRLERCRGRPDLDELRSVTVEWCDAAHRFRLVPSLAHRAPAAAHTRLRSREHPLRAG